VAAGTVAAAADTATTQAIAAAVAAAIPTDRSSRAFCPECLHLLLGVHMTSENAIDPHSELINRIERLLDEKVRPELETDAGGIELVGLDPDNILQVRLTGACQGCSSSVITLSMRVESILKAEIPEIRFVEAVP
jgi:Fe-S cluster biogenesis protein NfuA